MVALMAGPHMGKKRGRQPKPGGEGIPVRIDPEVVRMMRMIVADTGGVLSDCASDFLRPVVLREYQKLKRRMSGPEGKDRP